MDGQDNGVGNEAKGMHIDFAVQGMSCSACAARIERAVGRLPGIEHAAVSFPLRMAWIQYAPNKLTAEQIKERIAQLGFTAESHEGPQEGLRKERRSLKLRLAFALVLTLPLLAGMVQHIAWLEPVAGFLPPWLFNSWLQLALATVIQFVIGMPFYFGAFHALRQRSANMDVLVAVGTTAAYLYSHYIVLRGLPPASGVEGHGLPLYFETSAVVITAVLVGKYLETSASLKVQQEAGGYEQAVGWANVERGGQLVRLQAEFVRAGEIVRVGPGEAVPVDGIIVEGVSSFDEALLTGEGMPVAKRPGEQAWAGTRNESAPIRLRTGAAGHETMLSRIQALVRQAQRSKSALQRKVDAAAGWFVPVMLLLSLLTFLLWGLAIRPGEWQQAFVCGIAVLLAACPCALGLAAPISLVIAAGHMAKQGIIAKEAGALERLAGVQTLVIDKTGTLTEGRPTLAAISEQKGSGNRLLRLAAAAEAETVHPLARAIVYEAKKRGLIAPKASEFKHEPGGGVEAVIEGRAFALGNARFAARRGMLPPEGELAFAQAEERAGHTVLYAALDGQPAGMLAFQDKVKPQARAAIGRLQQFGVDIVLATGDHQAPAHAAAEATGITNVRSSLLPEAKAALVESFKQNGKRVAMAGDGWNDAPALATADVGIAMGDGSQAALSAGHLTLLFSRLEAIPEAIAISRLTLRNVRQNLAFAFVYNACVVPFAAFGHLEPWMAGTAMAMSSVSVVGNALLLSGRLRAYQEKEQGARAMKR